MGTQSNPRRVVEAALAAALLVVAIPLICLGAAASWACYRTWPFFVHDRVGLDGRRFRLAKVRTLPPATNQYADKYSIGMASLPRVMRLVRALHLDELPQLWHVICGDMAFVGPRPEMPALHDALPPLFAYERTSVLPGITGLWQISPHNAGMIHEHPEYDRLYVSFRSPTLDLWIMLRTVHKMVLGRTTQLFEAPPAIVRTQVIDLTRELPARHAPSLARPVPAGQLSLVD